MGGWVARPGLHKGGGVRTQTPASTRCLPPRHASAWPHLTEERLLSMRKKSSFAFWGGRGGKEKGTWRRRPACPPAHVHSPQSTVFPPKGPAAAAHHPSPTPSTHPPPPQSVAQQPRTQTSIPIVRLSGFRSCTLQLWLNVDLSQFCTSRHAAYLKYTSHFPTCYLSTCLLPPYLPCLLCRRPIP